MPQICKCCSHEDRDMIDDLIIRGFPNRRIAAQFNLKEQSVRRHKASHLSKTLLAAEQMKELAQADALVERLSNLLLEAESLLKELKKRGDLRGAVSSLGELRRIIEMIAKLGTEIWENQAINIHRDPAWSQIRTKIIQVLGKYPDAKEDIIIMLTGECDD